MSQKIVECIPNFSEARRPEVVETIVQAARDIGSVTILDYSSDNDHNRSVVTFVGSPEGVEEAAFRMIAKAAKLIDLDPKKEPEIHKAVFHSAPYLEHGAIVENTMMYPDGHFDLFDDRFTPNSRASYRLSELTNIKDPPAGSHPRTILFLTADANGVIPPVSRLDRQQAMLWFLMGYTSKLAGTETGIVEYINKSNAPSL